jgi:hypothetical protein
LERGRARLHERLLRRGLTLSAVLAAAEASRGAAPAVTVAGLIARTVQGAVAFGTYQTAEVEGVSAGATVVAREILRGMALAKVKMTAALMLATCLLATRIVIKAGATSSLTSAPDLRSSSVWLHLREIRIPRRG